MANKTLTIGKILISLSALLTAAYPLIGDWNEFMAFPDQGTVVAKAVEQAVGLFNAFDFLDAAGNLMVIFTDGADADVLENGKTVDDVLAEAQKAKARAAARFG